MNYSIIKEKWIPAKLLDGQLEVLSLREIFEKASFIEKINHDNEMINLGIIRLLCVFFMDIYKPEGIKNRIRYFNDDHFDMLKFDNYISECEKIGNCFDLFDSEVPFLQTGEMDANTTVSPAARISDFHCSGEEITFLNGKNETEYSFFPDECARLLCQKMTTVIKAKQGEGFLAFTPLQNAIFMLNKGENLKETIVLNSLSRREWEDISPIAYGTEDNAAGPSWRQGKKKDQKKEFIQLDLSLLSLMTFMPVNIKLLLDDDNVIRKTFYTSKNYKDKKDPEKNGFLKYKDPMTILRINKKDDEETTFAAVLNPEAGFWEIVDAMSIFGVDIAENSNKQYRTPEVIKQSFSFSNTKKTEIWSPCKNDNGKGIIYHDVLTFPDEFFDEQFEIIQRDTQSISKIINDFNNTKINSSFKALSVNFWKKYISDIQRCCKLFMSQDYINHFLPGIQMSWDDGYEQVVDFTNNYRNKVINQFISISNDYLDQMPGNFEFIMKKSKCKIEIKKYFIGKMYKEEK